MLHFDALKIYICGKHCKKRRNCLWQAISPFLSMFSTPYSTYFSFSMHFKMLSAICFKLDQSKVLLSGNGLTVAFPHRNPWRIMTERIKPLTIISLSKAIVHAGYLTLSQMTNFRLFQTLKRVCRRQFQIWWKWLKVFRKSRKHCGKRRNCLLWAISLFSAVFSKDLYCRQVKIRACLGKG